MRGELRKFDAIMAVVLGLCVVATLTLRIQSNIENSRQDECIGSVVQANVFGSAVKTEAAKKRDAADRKLTVDLRGMPNDSKAVRDAKRAYRTGDDELDQARKDYPVPKVKDYCNFTPKTPHGSRSH